MDHLKYAQENIAKSETVAIAREGESEIAVLQTDAIVHALIDIALSLRVLAWKSEEIGHSLEVGLYNISEEIRRR